MDKPQRIRDPLHNLITFEQKTFDQVLWRVIQTPAFQRLRRIKQLGFSEFVYPGATHTRFSHSLGVYHIANRLLEIVKQNEKEYNEIHAHHARAAALLHDIGHGPFSHAFEEVRRRCGLKQTSHEDISVDIISNGDISHIFEREYGIGFSANVAKIIASSGASHGIYGAIVSSQFDADRLDYMQRDRLMTGIQLSGGLDTTWLLSNLTIGEVDVSTDDSTKGRKTKTFVLGPKALYAAQTYIMGLFQMYPTVYLHKATRGAEKLFTELMVRVFSIVRDSHLKEIKLPAHHPITLYAKKPTLSRFINLDDAVIMGMLSLLCSAKDKITANLAQRLLTRRLFKCIDIRERLKHTICGKFSDAGYTEEVEKRLTVAQRKIQNRIAEWTETSQSPRILEDSGQRAPYKQRLEEDSLFGQILIKDTGGNIIDIDTCSEVVKSIRPFKFYRVYIAEEDDEALKIVNQAIQEQEHAQ